MKRSNRHNNPISLTPSIETNEMFELRCKFSFLLFFAWNESISQSIIYYFTLFCNVVLAGLTHYIKSRYQNTNYKHNFVCRHIHIKINPKIPGGTLLGRIIK